jgi:hypothetical protein
MADNQHTAPNLSAATACVTLRALADSLGELEPPRADGDVTDQHLQRQGALFEAAAVLPVRSAEDAALALAAVADTLGDVLAFDLAQSKLEWELRKAFRILARLADWVNAQQAAPPLTSMWPSKIR